MTTARQPDAPRSIEGHRLSNLYVTTIDADLEAAYAAAVAIDPMRRLAKRLCALGLDDRAVVRPSSQAGRPADPHSASELGFNVLWRFGPSGDTARLTWRLRLSENGMGRTMLSVAIHAHAGTDESATRLAAAWPIVETIAGEQFKDMRRAIDDYADDAWETERAPARTVQTAAA